MLDIPLPETNIKSPVKNQQLEDTEDTFPFGRDYFQVRTVSFREGVRKNAVVLLK